MLVLENFGSRPSCSQNKCLGCLRQRQVSILYLVTLSRWDLWSISRASLATQKGDLVFRQITSQTVFRRELSSRTRFSCTATLLSRWLVGCARLHPTSRVCLQPYSLSALGTLVLSDCHQCVECEVIHVISITGQCCIIQISSSCKQYGLV